MPVFTFKVEGGQSDEAELTSIAEAKCEALRYASKLICDSADAFWDTADFHMVVTDDNGLVLFALRVIGTEAPAVMGAAPTDMPGPA